MDWIFPRSVDLACRVSFPITLSRSFLRVPLHLVSYRIQSAYFTSITRYLLSLFCFVLSVVRIEVHQVKYLFPSNV